MKLIKFNLLLTFWLIAISGNPAANVISKEILYGGTLIIFLVIYIFKPFKLTQQDRFILGFFALILIVHIANYGVMVAGASFGFLVRLSIAFLAVKLISEYPRRYVTVMYVLSLVSFVFFIPLYLGIDMRNLLATVRVSIPLDDVAYQVFGLHNLREEYYDVGVRNMGMFWEPGAFAGYLILAIFIVVRDNLNNLFMSKKGLVLIVALLSTQSSTGYLGFLVVIVFYAFKMGWFKRQIAKLVIAPIFFVIFTLGVSVLFNQVSFLGEKINASIEQTAVRDDASRLNRFGNFIYDQKWIIDKPILGWSANPATRFSIDPELVELIQGQGNGLTGFAVKFGLVGLLLYIGLIAYNTWSITGSKVDAFFCVFIICTLLNGEQFLNFPVFLSLMFLSRKATRFLPSTGKAHI